MPVVRRCSTPFEAEIFAGGHRRVLSRREAVGLLEILAPAEAYRDRIRAQGPRPPLACSFRRAQRPDEMPLQEASSPPHRGRAALAGPSVAEHPSLAAGSPPRGKPSNLWSRLSLPRLRFRLAGLAAALKVALRTLRSSPAPSQFCSGLRTDRALRRNVWMGRVRSQLPVSIPHRCGRSRTSHARGRGLADPSRPRLRRVFAWAGGGSARRSETDTRCRGLRSRGRQRGPLRGNLVFFLAHVEIHRGPLPWSTWTPRAYSSDCPPGTLDC